MPHPPPRHHPHPDPPRYRLRYVGGVNSKVTSQMLRFENYIMGCMTVGNARKKCPTPPPSPPRHHPHPDPPRYRLRYVGGVNSKVTSQMLRFENYIMGCMTVGNARKKCPTPPPSPPRHHPHPAAIPTPPPSPPPSPPRHHPHPDRPSCLILCTVCYISEVQVSPLLLVFFFLLQIKFPSSFKWSFGSFRPSLTTDAILASVSSPGKNSWLHFFAN